MDDLNILSNIDDDKDERMNGGGDLKSDFSIDEFLKEEKLELTDFKLDEIAPIKEDLDKAGKIFDADTSLYSKAFLSKLKEEKLIKDYDFGREMSVLDSEKIIELANISLPIQFDKKIQKEYNRLVDSNKLLQKKFDTLEKNLSQGHFNSGREKGFQQWSNNI